jgi:hypothetical protein
MPLEDYEKFHLNFTDGSNQAIIALASIFRLIGTFETSSCAILKEKIISDYSGFFLETNSFIFEAYNDNIGRLVESGIIQKLSQNLSQSKQPVENDPIPLSLDHLLIWFQLWGAFLLVAALFFLCEFLMARLKKFQVRQ